MSKGFNLLNWFWFYKKTVYNGFVIGFLKVFSIWFAIDGLEFTIAKPSYKAIQLWWRIINVIYNPFKITVYKR